MISLIFVKFAEIAWFFGNKRKYFLYFPETPIFPEIEAEISFIRTVRLSPEPGRAQQSLVPGGIRYA